MTKMKRSKLLPILIIALALLMTTFGACSSPAEPATSSSAAGSSQNAEPEAPPITGDILIAAAASLENVMTQDIIPGFNALYPDVVVTGSYDSSGKLQEQIEGGLEPAIFFSAAMKQMNALVEGEYINEADVTKLLQNELVLITSVNSETAVTGFENIADAKSLAIGDPASVPAGQYAEEALTSLGVWDKVSKGASLGTNVVEVLNWVAEGSAEVGIVYATDAAGMPDKVRVVATAPEGSLASPVVYPVAALKSVSAENVEATQLFIEYLKGGEAKAVFEKYGFKPL